MSNGKKRKATIDVGNIKRVCKDTIVMKRLTSLR